MQKAMLTLTALAFLAVFSIGVERPERGCNAFSMFVSDSDTCYSCMIEDARIFNAQGEYEKALAILALVPATESGRSSVYATAVTGKMGFSITNAGSFLSAFSNTNADGISVFYSVLSNGELMNTNVADMEAVLADPNVDQMTKVVTSVGLLAKLATECDDNNNASGLTAEEWAACGNNNTGSGTTYSESSANAVQASCTGYATSTVMTDDMKDKCEEICTAAGDPTCLSINSNDLSSILM